MSDERREADGQIEQAQAAYEGYAANTGGKTFDGRQMPSWAELPEQIRNAWRAAVHVVAAHYRDELLELRGLLGTLEASTGKHTGHCLIRQAFGDGSCECAEISPVLKCVNGFHVHIRNGRASSVCQCGASVFTPEGASR